VTESEGSANGAMAVPPTVAEFLEKAFPLACPDLAFHAMQGDASDRSYFRVAPRAPGPGSGTSYILMRLAGPWIPGEGAGELPFVNIARHLSEKGVPVPNVCVDASARGFVLLEDMGDVTLEAFLRTCSPGDRQRSYREAVRILVRMQKEASLPSSRSCSALSYAFDAETFFRELCFFREHAIEGLWQREVSSADREILDDQFMFLCREIARYPRAFTHRDYHSRNLMVGEKGLAVLDFQDARLGPITYDLASLLRDSYVELDSGEEREMFLYYRELCLDQGLPLPGEEALWNAFVRTGLQRNLKAVGTFAFQAVVRGADRYRESIPPTLRRIRNALEETPDLLPLWNVLEKYEDGLSIDVQNGMCY
jgi:aminoglycoside/choline kinase family phosphotransferase